MWEAGCPLTLSTKEAVQQALLSPYLSVGFVVVGRQAMAKTKRQIIELLDRTKGHHVLSKNTGPKIPDFLILFSLKFLFLADFLVVLFQV